MDFYSAQICMNGHIISTYSNNIEKCCSICGAKTITTCPYCNNIIRGKQKTKSIILDTQYILPNYCYECGEPYPWTQANLEAIRELILFDEQLSDNEKAYINDNVQNLIVDTPKTTVVATKFNVFLHKASTVTVKAIRDILVDIVSETAKKIIFQ